MTKIMVSSFVQLTSIAFFIYVWEHAIIIVNHTAYYVRNSYKPTDLQMYYPCVTSILYHSPIVREWVNSKPLDSSYRQVGHDSGFIHCYQIIFHNLFHIKDVIIF